VTATVGKRPSEEELAQQQMFDPDAQGGLDSDQPAPGSGVVEQALGVQVIRLTPQIARQLGAPDNTQGVVVAGVDPNSDAGAKGLQRGDIILSANYKALTQPSDLETAVSTAKSSGREAVLLQIQRRGRPATYVPIRLR
jgi:serine protease Do